MAAGRDAVWPAFARHARRARPFAKDDGRGSGRFQFLSLGSGARPARQSELVHGPAHHRLFQRDLGRAEELQRLAETSHPRVIVDTAGLDPAATELAHLLAAKIGGLSAKSLRDLEESGLRRGGARSCRRRLSARQSSLSSIRPFTSQP